MVGFITAVKAIIGVCTASLMDPARLNSVTDVLRTLMFWTGGCITPTSVTDSPSTECESTARRRQVFVDGYCSNLYVAESGLYFDMRDEHNSAQIYHANLDGSEMKLIIPDMKLCYYYDGIVYCSNTQKLCTYDLETGTLSAICEEYTYNVSVNDSGIYFWDVNNDCFCRIDGVRSTEVIVSGGDFYNLTGTKLYHTGYGGVSSKSPCICCVDVETKERERVLSLSDQYFDIDGNLLGLTVDMQITEIVDESLFDDEASLLDTVKIVLTHMLLRIWPLRAGLSVRVYLKPQNWIVLFCWMGETVWFGISAGWDE